MPAPHTPSKCKKYRCTSPTFLSLLRATSPPPSLFLLVLGSQITMNTKSYISLRRAQKALLHNEVANRKSKGQDVIAVSMASWAIETFTLPALPARRTVSCLIKEGPTRMPSDGRAAKQRRNKHSAKNELERRHYAWICDMSNKRRCVSRALIRAQAEKIRDALVESTLNLAISSLKFLEGWLTNFKRCWRLRSFRSHGESGDSDQTAIDATLPDLQSFLADYDKNDIFSADKCGLRYRMVPDRTIST